MIDLGPKGPENRIHLFDPVGLINDKYSNYVARPKQSSTSASGGSLKFVVEPKVADTESEGSSPRLWKASSSNSPPASPRFMASPSHQLQNFSHQHQQQQPQQQLQQQQHRNPEPMSPNSRTEAIARGRRELMEMIKDIPETYYDLSLRDLVDKKPPSPRRPPPATVEFKPSQVGKKVEVVEKNLPQQEAPKEKDDKKKKKESKKKKVGKSESKKKMMMKNRSVDNGGFLLKTTVFPIPFRSKKKKRSLGDPPSFKIAQKPNPKSGNKHWWVRKSRVSNETEKNVFNPDSSSTSRSSSIVSRNKQNTKFLPSCCTFFKEKRKLKSKK